MRALARDGPAHREVTGSISLSTCFGDPGRVRWGTIAGVADTFPRASKLGKGYDVDQVEAFLTRARSAYEDGGRGPAMTSWHVRTVGFDLVRGGYEVEAVDAALDRIEDAFARRESCASLKSSESGFS